MRAHFFLLGFIILLINAIDYLGGFFGLSSDIKLPSSGIGVGFHVLGIICKRSSNHRRRISCRMHTLSSSKKSARTWVQCFLSTYIPECFLGKKGELREKTGDVSNYLRFSSDL